MVGPGGGCFPILAPPAPCELSLTLSEWWSGALGLETQESWHLWGAKVLMTRYILEGSGEWDWVTDILDMLCRKKKFNKLQVL